MADLSINYNFIVVEESWEQATSEQKLDFLMHHKKYINMEVLGYTLDIINFSSESSLGWMMVFIYEFLKLPSHPT